VIKKEYYTLDEVVLMFKCTKDDLIHLGAQDKLPIYVLADGWHAHLWAREIVETDTEDGYTEQTLGEPFPSSRPYKPLILNGPIPLDATTLLKFEANNNVVINSFAAQHDVSHAPGYINEYRFCSPKNPAKSVDVALKDLLTPV